MEIYKRNQSTLTIAKKILDNSNDGIHERTDVTIYGKEWQSYGFNN